MRCSTVARIGSVIKKTHLIVKKGDRILFDLDNSETIGAWKTPLEARR
jgi:hypothetical protein